MDNFYIFDHVHFLCAQATRNSMQRYLCQVCSTTLYSGVTCQRGYPHPGPYPQNTRMYKEGFSSKGNVWRELEKIKR